MGLMPMLNRNSNKEIAFGTGTNIFLGVIEDRKDPEQLGRFRVRVVGIHTENKTDLPTAGLPWAPAMLPTTSPSLNGIGSNPFLLEGSWVIVMFMDSEFQEPIILGSIAGATTEKRNQEMGFSDPRGFYPRAQIDDEGNVVDEAERTADSDINRRARGGLDRKLRKDANYLEPEDPYDALYPYNRVFESESGHIIELDDTPDAERINIWHRTGSFIEISPNGDMRLRGADLFNSSDNQVINVDGNFDLTVADKCNITVQGDSDIRAVGNVFLGAECDVTADIKGQTTLNLEQEVTINSREELSIIANAAVNIDTERNIFINAKGEPHEVGEEPEEGEPWSDRVPIRDKITGEVIEERERREPVGIMITTDRSLTVKTLEDFEVIANGNINMEARGNITMKSAAEDIEYKEAENKPDMSTGRGIDISTDKTLTANILENMNFNIEENFTTISNSNVSVGATGTIAMNAEGNLSAQSNSSIAIGAGGAMDISSVDGAQLRSNDTIGVNAGEALDLTSQSTTTAIGSTVQLNPLGRSATNPGASSPGINITDLDLMLEIMEHMALETIPFEYDLEPIGEVDVEIAPVPVRYKAPTPEELKTLYIQGNEPEECDPTDDDCNTADVPPIPPTPVPDDDEATELPPILVQSTDKSVIKDMKGSVTYTNYNAVRDQELNGQLENIIKSAANQTGLHVEIFSGGQDSSGSRRVGSHRHDNGFAADIYLFAADDMGRVKKLRSDSAAAQDFISAAKSAGAKSAGAGRGYMGGFGIHIDIAPGNTIPAKSATYWGANGRSRNAPSWLRSLFA